MQTKTINIYSFAELCEDAQNKAIENYRNSDREQSFYYDEIIQSVKAVAELFSLKFGNEYSDIRTGHIDDNILQLKGVRLYKYLVNNYYSDLFKPAYIKTIDGEHFYKQFICKRFKGQKGMHTQIYSRIRISKDNCPLTGVCYDADILAPIYDFIAKIDTSMTFEDLLDEIGNTVSKCFENTEEWLNSDEFIREELINNEHTEYTEDGKEY